MPKFSRNNLLTFIYSSSVFLSCIGLAVLGIAPVLYALIGNVGFDSAALFFRDNSLRSAIFDSLFFSVLQATASASVSVVTGMIIGRVLWLRPGPVSHALVRLLVIPFGLPSIVICFALVVAFGNAGYLNKALTLIGWESQFLYNAGAIIFAHAFFNTGMAAREFINRYDGIPVDLWRSSANLGLGRISQFRHVEWPYLWRSAASLWALIFAMSLTSFAIVLTLGGRPDLTTLEVLIYQLIRYDSDLTGAFLASAVQILFLLLASLLAFAVAQKLGPPPPSGHGARTRVEARTRPVSRLSYLLTVLLCLVFFVFPLGALVVDGIHALVRTPAQGLADQVKNELLPAMTTSLYVGIPVTVLSTFAAIVTAQFVARTAHSKSTHQVMQSITFVLLAFSPTVLGFSWLQCYTDLSLNPFSHSHLTVIAIQTFLFFPMAFRVIYPDALLRYKSARDTYQSLGVPLGLQTLWVEFLELLPSVRSSLLLVLAFSFGDAATPALFGDIDFSPLALHLLELMGSYQFEKASIATILLILMTQLLHFVGSRKRRHA